MIEYMVVKDSGRYYALRRGKFLWWDTWVKICNSETSWYFSQESAERAIEWDRERREPTEIVKIYET